MTKNQEIGRILRASTTGFAVGCRVGQLSVPAFGGLVQAQPVDDRECIYGLIYNMSIDDDPLVRRLVLAENPPESVISDQRQNRLLPIEMSVLAVGYEQDGRFHHLLPPRPPLSLDVIYACDDKDIIRFTERFGYFRHILNGKDVPVGEVVAAHILQAGKARGADGARWIESATQEVITLLRDDYPTLMSVLGALADIS